MQSDAVRVDVVRLGTALPDGDEDPYPLPFHPLELGEDALRALCGFVLVAVAAPVRPSPARAAVAVSAATMRRIRVWFPFHSGDGAVGCGRSRDPEDAVERRDVSVGWVASAVFRRGSRDRSKARVRRKRCR
ncbi:DUF6928 family protein [Streptomyces sp. NPDC003393]